MLLSGSLASCISKPSTPFPSSDGFTLVPIAESNERAPLIVVDQFGYQTKAKKVAVLRTPMVGFDSSVDYQPGKTIELKNAINHDTLIKAAPDAWKQGAVHQQSGDKVWHFDFSSVEEPGTYYILDKDNNVRSAVFKISDTVYHDVLKHAVRALFYQRAGFEKKAPFADPRWSDKASHIDTNQDLAARDFRKPYDATTERDLSGGWYDAGDYNKYTSWTANYVISLLHSYLERPEAWTDDYNIPESGNGIPDVIDETLWGIRHLARLQNTDGGVLSIVDMAEASPPSAAKEPSTYGPASTSATLTAAASYALAAYTLPTVDESFEQDADALKDRAIRAWNWAEKNPKVIFRNNEGSAKNIGAGQQEVDDTQRLGKKVQAAIYLFAITEDERFKTFIDEHYDKGINRFQVSPFSQETHTSLLFYATHPKASKKVSRQIKSHYKTMIETWDDYRKAVEKSMDPYMAYLKHYTWGSTRVSANMGNMFLAAIDYGVVPDDVFYVHAAQGYVNYLHGVNPLGLVLLSNMQEAGAERSVTEFYHNWFKDGSEVWDSTVYSKVGPAPGFVVGGPNPSYSEADCCPAGCGDWGNMQCGTGPNQRLTDQPDMKSYYEFNTSWPINSWEITENSNGYQVAYIKLLSKFL